MATFLDIQQSGGANFEAYHLRNVSSLHIGGSALASGALQVTGAASISGALTLGGAIDITGAFTATGSGVIASAGTGYLNVGNTDTAEMRAGDARLSGCIWIKSPDVAPTARTGYTAIYTHSDGTSIYARLANGTSVKLSP